MIKKDKTDFDLINMAEKLIYSPKKRLTPKERNILANHRKHLINQIEYYRYILKANYNKDMECEDYEA